MTILLHVVGVQPDHPDRTVPLDKMLVCCKENKYDDFLMQIILVQETDQ